MRLLVGVAGAELGCLGDFTLLDPSVVTQVAALLGAFPGGVGRVVLDRLFLDVNGGFLDLALDARASPFVKEVLPWTEPERQLAPQ